MEAKGKRLEYIIQIIQETLKDSPNTIIHKNYKIENIGGRMREFDVFIESKINNFDIKIAIECKDYKIPVSAEKIEAFETKCNRIPGINKKVFVSSNGFQKEAKNVAKDCNIELQTASTITPSSIIGWFSLSSISVKILPDGNSQLFLSADEEYLKTMNPSLQSIFIFNDVSTTLNLYLTELYTSNKNLINDIALTEWIKLTKAQKNKPFLVPYAHEPTKLYLIDKNDKKIKVTGILIRYQFLFVETLTELKESIVLKNLDGEIKANTFSVNLDEEIEGNFVRTPDNKTRLHIKNKSNKNLDHIRIVTFSDEGSKIIKFK